MKHKSISKIYEVEDVVVAVRNLFSGRLFLHKGMAEIAPGITIHSVGGHTPGSQVVRVATKRGYVVLASDAAHLWANIRLRSPLPILDDLAKALDAFNEIENLADSPDHIIPGHDPQVATCFVQWNSDPHIFCLHEPLQNEIKIPDFSK